MWDAGLRPSLSQVRGPGVRTRKTGGARVSMDVLPPARILVADAQAADRAPIVELFRAQGCTLEEAPDTARAWALLQSHPFDLVILDARLPDANGLELLRQMRRLDSLPVVVLVFDRPSPALEKLAHSLGAAFCDRKPVDLERLAKLVQRSRGEHSQ